MTVGHASPRPMGIDAVVAGRRQITAVAAGHDALWVGAPAGLFRVDFRAMP